MPISTPDGRCDAPRQQSWRTLESRVLRKAHARFGEGRLEKCQQWQLASRLLYFAVTGASKDVLEFKVFLAVRQFLAVRGLELSEEKTRITNIAEGFDFLG
jgi:hypothetical protein